MLLVPEGWPRPPGPERRHRGMSMSNSTFNKRRSQAGIPLALAFGIVIAVAVACWVFPHAVAANSASELQTKIERAKQREGILTSDLETMSSRIRALKDRVAKISRQQQAAESRLQAEVGRKARITSDLRRAKSRLRTLRTRLARSRSLLAKRIVAVYKSGSPDIIDVVLDSSGFADMVSRATYLNRVAKQDKRIISSVARLKDQSKRQAAQLAKLERSAEVAVANLSKQRDAIAAARSRTAGERDRLVAASRERRVAIAGIARKRHSHEGDLSALQRTSDEVADSLGSQGRLPSSGSGRFIVPISGTMTSPFGQRWGRLHAGIDFGAPVGTTIRAADGGTVRQAGWMGGYGNYTCVQHTASLSSCYAHQSSIGVRTGQAVRKGQTIGRSGNTGNSTGPHLHFEARQGGQPVDPMGFL